MNWKDSIRASIRGIAGTAGLKNKPDVYYASVDDVDEKSRTCSCTLINGTSDISLTSVNLMAEVNDGLLRIPTKGSTVYILSTPNITPFVDVFSELDKIFYVAGGSAFLIDTTGIQLDGKTFGGIPKVDPVTTKISALEKDLNAIKQVFSTAWTVVPNDGGAALKAAASTWAGQIFEITQKSDLENTKVQHGDGS